MAGYSNGKIDDEVRKLQTGRLYLYPVTADDMRRLFEHEDVSQLKTLTIQGNHYDASGNIVILRFGDSGADALANGLQKSPLLEELSLNDNGIGDAGVQLLAKKLGCLQHLRKLDLHDNEIGDAGAQALAICLSTMTALEKLLLNENAIGDTGGRALAEHLSSHRSIQCLDLERNRLADASARALALALPNLASLKELNLGYNRISDDGAEAIANRLNIVSGLKVSLCRNNIGDKGLVALQPYSSYVNVEDNWGGWSQEKKRSELERRKLFDALEEGNFAIAEQIVEAQPPPSSILNDALFYACTNSRLDSQIVDWLLTKGADINARGSISRTPLHEAIMRLRGDHTVRAKENQLKKISILVGRGADLSAREEHGLTPRGIADYMGYDEASALLSGISPRSTWERAHPVEASYELISRQLISEHGPLILVEYLSHFPKFEINFHYQDGTRIYSGERTGKYDINFLSLGYTGEGPRYAEYFLGAAGFKLSHAVIAGIKPGDQIVLENGKPKIVKRDGRGNQPQAEIIAASEFKSDPLGSTKVDSNSQSSPASEIPAIPRRQKQWWHFWLR